MPDWDKPISREDIYQAKAEQRKIFAKEPFEVKLQTLLRLQYRNFVIKKASGRKAHAYRPWNMAEEEYQKEMANWKLGDWQNSKESGAD